MKAIGGVSLQNVVVKSVTCIVLLQVVFRLVTFVLNAILLRYITREYLGIVNVRLVLLYNTLLFISREAFRKSCLSKNDEIHWKQIRNLAWCTIPVGIGCSIVLIYAWINIFEQPSDDAGKHYIPAVMLFAVSGLIELLAEPIWILSQIYLYIKLKIVIEGLALIIRCLLTILLVVCLNNYLGLVSFSIAFVACSITYVTIYYGYFFILIANKNSSDAKNFPVKTLADFLPLSIQKTNWTSPLLISQTWSFLKQSLLKQCLTEGERYVMTAFNLLDFGEQGIYDVINNLGSLAARCIFLPIEENYYLFFAQSLRREVPANEQKHVCLVSETLEALLKFMLLVSLTILVFGLTYSRLLLRLYGGNVLSIGAGPILLRWYCAYVVLLAVNGVTECFVFAVISKQHMERYNWLMVVFSVVFLVFSLQIIPRFGSVGFIWANCINMLLRISHRWYFRSTAYKPLMGLLLSPWVTAMYAFAFLTTWWSEITFGNENALISDLVHIGIGSINLLIVLLVVYMKEKNLIVYLTKQFLPKKHS